MKKSTIYSYLSITILSVIILLSACSKKNKQLKPGMWRGVLVSSNEEIPFLMQVEKKGEDSTIAYLINGSEKILLDEIKVEGDSVTIPLHIFDADLKAHINNQEDGMKGKWNGVNSKGRFTVNFSAKLGQSHRFSKNPRVATENYSGKWEVLFKHGDGTQEKAIGVFEQIDNKLKGTFLSATGDYRYLDGEVSGDELRLSTFDGSHAYLFKAQANNQGNLEGKFYSGKEDISTWTGIRNNNAKLPAADTLTYLKKGYDKLTFTFPDLTSQKVSLSDPKYTGKVVVVQLMGSWCPNCMDETAYLAPYYEKNKSRGVEVIGLAYEQTPEFSKSKIRLDKLKHRFNIGYDILVAGTRDKEAAAKTLPMLNHVLAFPTTIIIDKKGDVRKIHTGFSGPGTGKYYEAFKRDFESTIDKLLQE